MSKLGNWQFGNFRQSSHDHILVHLWSGRSSKALRRRLLLCLLLWVIWSNWYCLMYVLNWGSRALLAQSDTGFQLRKWSFPCRCRCMLDKAENRQMCLYAPGKRCGEGQIKQLRKFHEVTVKCFWKQSQLGNFSRVSKS